MNCCCCREWLPSGGAEGPILEIYCDVSPACCYAECFGLRLFWMSGCAICVAGKALNLVMLYISCGSQCVKGSMDEYGGPYSSY